MYFVNHIEAWLIEAPCYFHSTRNLDVPRQVIRVQGNGLSMLELDAIEARANPTVVGQGDESKSAGCKIEMNLNPQTWLTFRMLVVALRRDL